MRPIKFRAWTGLRIVDYAQQDKMGRLDVSWEGHDIELVLMQFTGLTDKNGKPIYEGDIVSNNGYQGKASVVKWNEEGAYFHIYRGDTPSGYTLQGETRDCEVIGNIWENGDLLNK